MIAKQRRRAWQRLLPACWRSAGVGGPRLCSATLHCAVPCTPCSRRPAWQLVPWDPAALYVLYRRHQQVYEELVVRGGGGRCMYARLWCATIQVAAPHGLAAQAVPHGLAAQAVKAAQARLPCVLPQAQASERRLFTADQPPPPSQLREGRTLLQARRGAGGQAQAACRSATVQPPCRDCPRPASQSPARGPSRRRRTCCARRCTAAPPTASPWRRA
jgi:hypothetical protein